MKIREALRDAWNAMVSGAETPPPPSTVRTPVLTGPVASSEHVSNDGIPNMPVPVDQVSKVMDSNIEVIAKYIFLQVRKAILHQQDTARLFYINGSNLVAEVKAADFEANLRDLYSQFIKSEHYEYAQECDRIIKKLLVHKVIDESRHRG